MNIWLASFAGIGIGLVGLFLIATSNRIQKASFVGPSVNPRSVILLRDGLVIHSNEHAQRSLGDLVLPGQSWCRLKDRLATFIDGLPDELPDQPVVLGDTGAKGQQLFLRTDGETRILELGDIHTSGDIAAADTPEDASREAVEMAVTPMWKTNSDSQIIWSNAAYNALIRDCGAAGEQPTQLFNLPVIDTKTARQSRASLETAAGKKHWFEITSQPTETGTLYYASNIDALVTAELAQRNFVQTLTKTFAHLPIGLSVFDKDHRLVLFNPALLDLTRLPVEFLSARPNLLSFFDHMRENRMMPEPKNYTSWRDQLSNVVNAAQDDRYCETWNLPSGLTYKITGRPHPDGAIAFLLEDISAEISLTRRFRSELEMTQSVIDSFDDAVAVFSQLGVLTFCNTAYRTLWDCEPDSAFAEMTIVDATQAWSKACVPTPVWPEIREFVLTLRDRAAWDTGLDLRQGGSLFCSVEPVAAGSTLVRFSKMTAASAVPAATMGTTE